MLGLTALGAVHTAISLIAIVAGAWAFIRDGEIAAANRLGKLYLLATVLTEHRSGAEVVKGTLGNDIDLAPYLP